MSTPAPFSLDPLPPTGVQLPPGVRAAFQALRLPAAGSHKGQNGKLLLVGGSELFHASSRWSLDVASLLVDMVFYASVPSNNHLIQEAKGRFWNGIVVGREEAASYAAEADCILIGPGMTRSAETTAVTEKLVRQFPAKKWVIDAGALQMITPQLLNSQMIITPHPRELAMVLVKLTGESEADLLAQIQTADLTQLQQWSAQLGGVTILLKGHQDLVASPALAEIITGGHPGMTKGGTGDVLAGLVAGLAATHSLWSAAVIGSLTNKQAGERLAATYGPFFNASLLITAIPQTLWELYQLAQHPAP